MTDFLLAIGSFAGLLVYSTVGVAVYNVLAPRFARDCDTLRRWRHHDSDCHHEFNAGFIGTLWPLTLTGWGLGLVVAFAARGPAAWGTKLARLLDRQKPSLSEREQRIIEKERELGIGGEQNGRWSR